MIEMSKISRVTIWILLSVFNIQLILSQPINDTGNINVSQPEPDKIPEPPQPHVKNLNYGPTFEEDLPDEDYVKAKVRSRIFDDEHDFQNDTYFDEWEQHMIDFVPDMWVSFSLNQRSEQFFYQEVDESSLKIKGSYFVSGQGSNGNVEFTVTDPKGKVIWHTVEEEDIFYFETSMPGIYVFSIKNLRWVEKFKVMFAIGLGNETMPLQADNIDDVSSHVAQVDRMVLDVSAESVYLWARQINHLQGVKSNLSRVMWFTAAEMLCLITIMSLQIYYIKNLVSDKRVF